LSHVVHAVDFIIFVFSSNPVNMLVSALLDPSTIIEMIQVILLSSVKFIFAFPLSFSYGFNYPQTIGLTTTGGILGVFVFYYLSSGIIKLYDYIKHHTKRTFLGKERHQKILAEKKKKSPFTRRNKFIVRIRGKFGMFGIVALTPTIISIPIGSFIIKKYYSSNRLILLYVCISVFIWSMIVSSFYFFKFV
jgi:hypothetical protein